MVQIIPRGRSSSDRFAQAFANAGQTAAEKIPEHLIGKEKEKNNAELIKQITGKDIKIPAAMQEEYIGHILKEKMQEEIQKRQFAQQESIEKLKGSNAKELEREKQTNREKLADSKSSEENTENESRYNTIKKHFGEKAAEIYKAAPEGGKTALLNSLLEAGQRGINFEDVLSQANPKGIEENQTATKILDFDKGLTPKERAQRQNTRYTTNLPLFEKSLNQLQTHEADKENLNILQELSPQLGIGTRILTNPLTGDLLLPAAASPEAQRYVKTINDFTKNAKESFGSRVTNFDLTQFLKRLPTLANSEEGRRQLIEQLQLINDINIAREQSLQDVFEEYGGVRSIDFDKAQQMADKSSKKEIDRLRGEFKNIGNRIEKEYDSQIKELKSIVPKDHVSVRRADGSTGYIPKDKVAAFLKVPGNEVL